MRLNVAGSYGGRWVIVYACPLLLAEAGGARRAIGSELDLGIALNYRTRLGREVAAGEELARVYLRAEDPDLEERFAGCFEIGAETGAPPLVVERIAPLAPGGPAVSA